MLEVNNVSGGYPGQRVLENVSFSVNRGEMFGILGPNGSGKTTLLKMISGILPPDGGKVFLKNRLLQEYSAKELARILAVLPQAASDVFSYSVKETVMLGRYARQRGWFHAWSMEDETAVREAMELTGTWEFQSHLLQELSGGERQRIFLSQALAQEPEILLLDEPTNHLDLSYQKELLDQLKRWTRERGLTVMTIFHDLNLASLYCDRLLLLDGGKVSVIGSPGEVLEQERIQRVYKTEIEKQMHPIMPKPQMVLIPEIGEERGTVDESCLSVSEGDVRATMDFPLKTLAYSSGESGFGWKKEFVLIAEGLGDKEAVKQERLVMAAPAASRFAVEYALSKSGGTSVFAVAILTNPAEALHLWVFINGELTEQAFVEAMVTAAESKADVSDPVAERGDRQDDSIIIAATQSGTRFCSGRPSSQLGSLIREAIYKTIK